jgi:hypothetical protein
MSVVASPHIRRRRRWHKSSRPLMADPPRPALRDWVCHIGSNRYRTDADEVIDASSMRFEDAGQVDAVIDTIGGDVQHRSFTIRDGYLVSVVAPPDAEEAERCGVHACVFIVDVDREYLTQVARSIDAGELQTRVGSILGLRCGSGSA